MKKAIFTIITAIGIIAIVSSCQNSTENKSTVKSENDSITSSAVRKPLRENVLTATEQQALTPDMVIQSLKEGNKRYTDNNLTAKNDSAMVHNASQGQYPKAVILSCIDSRVPVEDVFDQGIGDLFVARVAGNFVNDDILGSME
jgi:carbonic anhydrase